MVVIVIVLIFVSVVVVIVIVNICVSSGSNSNSFKVLVKQCFFNSSNCLACEGNSLNPSSR